MAKCPVDKHNSAFEYVLKTQAFSQQSDAAAYLVQAIKECYAKPPRLTAKDRAEDEVSDLINQADNREKLRQSHKLASSKLTQSVSSIKEFSRACGGDEEKKEWPRARQKKTSAPPPKETPSPSAETAAPAVKIFEPVIKAESPIKTRLNELRDQGKLQVGYEFVEVEYVDACEQLTKNRRMLLMHCFEELDARVRDEVDGILADGVKEWIDIHLDLTERKTSVAELDERAGGAVVKYFKRERNLDVGDYPVVVLNTDDKSDKYHLLKVGRASVKEIKLKTSYKPSPEALKYYQSPEMEFAIDTSVKVEAGNELAAMALRQQYGTSNVLFINLDDLNEYSKELELELVHALGHLTHSSFEQNGGKSFAKLPRKWIATFSKEKRDSEAYGRLLKTSAYSAFVDELAVALIRKNTSLSLGQARDKVNQAYIDFHRKVVARMIALAADGDAGMLETAKYLRTTKGIRDGEQLMRHHLQIQNDSLEIDLEPSDWPAGVKIPLADVIAAYWNDLYDLAK